MDAEWGVDWLADGRPRRLRELRRVAPVAQTVAISGVVLTVFSLDDYAEGFAVRLRLLLEDGHPVAMGERARQEAFDRRREEAARRGEDEFATDEDDWFLPYPELEVEASDDAGRQYRQWGGGSQWGSELVGWDEPHYAPALDPSARELRLRIEEVRWLTARTWQGGEIITVDRGPWTFAVPL